MASLNKPDRITLDAFSDATLPFTSGNNGSYFRFTNRLTTPILNAKGLQVVSANLINTSLQLNDQYQLAFYYYASNTLAGMCVAGNLRCVRLHPSWFVPASGYTAFSRNRYFTSVPELVTALNAAATTGGDSTTYNPLWVANQVTFSYDSGTRKISVVSTNGTTLIAPAAADDPNVQTAMASATNGLRLNGFNSGGTYATATLQPFALNESLNSRLGFAMSVNTRGIWWNGSSQIGCATSTGNPSAGAIEGDAYPILLGVQNVNIYADIVTGSGMDSLNRKNLAVSIPVDVAPLNVLKFIPAGIDAPSMSVPSEIYEITLEFRDEYGQPFLCPPSYNTQVSFDIVY